MYLLEVQELSLGIDSYSIKFDEAQVLVGDLIRSTLIAFIEINSYALVTL